MNQLGFKRDDIIMVTGEHGENIVAPVVQISDNWIRFRTEDGTLDWATRGDVVPASPGQVEKYRHAQRLAGEVVARSAVMLRQQKPGWALSVDPDDLDMSNPTWCLLGHVYGGYGDGMTALFGDCFIHDGVKWGFVDWSTYVHGQRVDVTYGHLQEAWEQVVATELQEI
jgi:hypothetical protein